MTSVAMVSFRAYAFSSVWKVRRRRTASRNRPLAGHHVVPGGGQGILEVGHEDLRPAVEGVDHHLGLHRPGDLHPAVVQVSGSRCDLPIRIDTDVGGVGAGSRAARRRRTGPGAPTRSASRRPRRGLKDRWSEATKARASGVSTVAPWSDGAPMISTPAGTVSGMVIGLAAAQSGTVLPSVRRPSPR